ncbi:MAG: hypothetical protein EZS28_009835 [Streblomastix strix]|uniref:Uncharacterized protein n=1 Tax=Streblomastix strix TaxID=222440 RepID=A0A5J4WK27_9EUKA|nr:MAG: hypothetical protein EZS28_009835 [Streblomastix strix]
MAQAGTWFTIAGDRSGIIDSFLSIHHAASIAAEGSQQHQEVTVASDKAKSVLGGGSGVSQLLGVESKKKLNEIIKTQKLMTSAASSEQKQIQTYVQGTGQQQELSVVGVQDQRKFGKSYYRQNGSGCYQDYGNLWPQNQWGGWNSGVAPFSGYFAAGPQMLGMGQVQPGFLPLPFSQYQNAYNTSVNPGLLGQYPGSLPRRWILKVHITTLKWRRVRAQTWVLVLTVRVS